MTVTYYWYRTPIGFITIAADDAGVCALCYGCVDMPGATKRATAKTTQAAREVLEYLSGKRRRFDVELHLTATSFQLRVWEAVRRIGYGQTATATQLARELGEEQAYRAVGTALNAVPVELIIPVHRVLRANGKPTGSTALAQRRQWMLNFEQEQLRRTQA